MNEDQKKLLFNFWDKMGISSEYVKYFGIKTLDSKEYFELMMEFLGVIPDTAIGSLRTYFQNLEEFICRDVNRSLFFDDVAKPAGCGDYKVKLWRLNLDRYVTNNKNLNYFKPMGDFLYSEPKEFQCPEEGFLDRLHTQYKDNCFDEYCLQPLVFPVGKFLKEKYGFSINYNMIKVDKRGEVFKLVDE